MGNGRGHIVRFGDKMTGGVEHDLRQFLAQFAGQAVDFADAFDLFTPKLDAVNGFAVRRLDF